MNDQTPPDGSGLDLPDNISPEILAAVEIKAASLDESDYFQILEVPTDADQHQIKDAYRALARDFHPDCFRNFPVPEFQAQANKLFKRINEAYFVLRDDAKRAQYVAGITGPQREKKLRWSDESEAQKQAAKRRNTLERMGTTSQGRDCYQLALRAIEGKRWAEAARQIKMAILYEPQNEYFKEKLSEVEAAAKNGGNG